MSKIKNDLTQGSITRTLVKYAIPMVATSLLQAVYSIVDIIIAGHYIGGNGISAINNSSLVMSLLTQVAIGFTVGGNILVGQYFGNKEEENRKKSGGTMFTFSLIFGAFFLIVFFLFARPIMTALGSPALNEAITYLKICSLGLVFIFGYNALSAILRAIGNSRVPLYCIITSTAVNVILDIEFMIVLDMGVLGAALGTMIAQGVAFLFALIYVIIHHKVIGFGFKYLKLVPDKLWKIIKLGFPLALQWTVASISWLVVMVLINKYGVDVSAGNGVSNKIKDFCQLFISAMCSAASTMAAQNMGAGQFDRAKKVMHTCMKITLGMAVVLIIVSEIFAPQLVRIFTDDPIIAGYAIENLRIEIIGQLFYAGFFTYNVLATGCGDTMFVMANSFLNCIVVRLVLAIIFAHLFGVVGIYVACMIAPSSSVPVGFAYYKSGRWKKRMTGKTA